MRLFVVRLAWVGVVFSRKATVKKAKADSEASQPFLAASLKMTNLRCEQWKAALQNNDLQSVHEQKRKRR